MTTSTPPPPAPSPDREHTDPACAEPAKDSQLTSESNQGKSHGRGGLAIAAAKIYFMLVGLGQQIALKAILGLGGYGAYSTASSVASITYNPIVQTSLLGVSREIAGAPDEERAPLLRALLRVHVIAAIAAGALFVALAGPIASVLGAAHVTTALRILGFVLVFYGIYAPLVGVLNGLHRFTSQATIDAIAATLRTVGLIGGAYLAMRLSGSVTLRGVEGANAGFAVAALFVLIVSTRLTGLGRSGTSRFRLREYISYIRPLAVGQILLNLVFQADALLLRRFASAAAASAGLASEAADPFVGAYRAAQLFSFLPYQLLMSVTFILFPLLAAAAAQGDQKAVREYVVAGVRLAVILAGAMVSVLVALPGGLIAFVYGVDAADLGATAMRPMALGLGAFAVLGVMTSALNGLGKPGISMRITALAVALVAALCWGFARGLPLSTELLERTAQATAAALLLSTLAAAVALRLEAGSAIPLATGLRTVLGVALAGFVGQWAFTPTVGHPSRLMTLAGAAVTAITYVGFLMATRELGRHDLERLRGLISR